MELHASTHQTVVLAAGLGVGAWGLTMVPRVATTILRFWHARCGRTTLYLLAADILLLERTPEPPVPQITLMRTMMPCFCSLVDLCPTHLARCRPPGYWAAHCWKQIF